MPFDFQNPKAKEYYEPAHGRRRRYWPYPGSIENLAYTPQEIASWRSVMTVSDVKESPTPSKKCMEKCFEKPMYHYYPESYLQEHLMLENPALLTALKNTFIMRDVPAKPIKFVPPHFIHRGKMSQFHLLVPKKYRAALCKITDNLYQEREMQKQELVNRKGRDVAAREVVSIPSKSDGSKSRKSKSSIDHASFTNMIKNEGLQGYNRRKMEEDIKFQELRTPDKHFFSSDVAFDKAFHNKYKPHRGRFAWDEEGGMESLCVNYPGISLFNESPSDILIESKRTEDELTEKVQKIKAKEIMQRIPPEMMKLFLNAPKQTIKRPLVSADQYDAFNHFGLLETAKADSLENCLKKLYRREKEVGMPEELLENTYGRLKGMPPGFKFIKPQLPTHLEINCAALPEELKKVEKAMKYEKLSRRRRKTKGMESDSNIKVSRIVAQFSKPIIESSENINVKSKHKSVAVDDFPEQYMELVPPEEILQKGQQTDATRHTFPESGQQQAFDNVLEISVSTTTLERPTTMQEPISSDREIKMRQIPTPSMLDISDPSSGNTEKPNENDFLLTDVKDSRESLPYPNVAFSAIYLPNIEEIENNWLYKKLEEDQRSLSSTDSHPDTPDIESQMEPEEEVVSEVGSETAIALDHLFKKAAPYLNI